MHKFELLLICVQESLCKAFISIVYLEKREYKMSPLLIERLSVGFDASR